ncbi:glycosyltransferase [Enterococcus gilvus]|uniref:glycosyltransferase family 2 protein n=1 Tax=Enterococcus gilvus TaxID=160453 RepID=UPI003D6C2F37
MRYSIIIPVYNSEQTIRDTIESCLNQTYKGKFEIIIINDGSTDSSQLIIDSYEDEKIKKFFHKNSGRSDSRNRGIKESSGKYILFLDSDDMLDIMVLEKVDKIFSNHSYDFCVFGASYVSQGKVIKTYSPKSFHNKQLLYKNIYPINTVVLKSEIAHSFLPKLNYCEDWLFWINTLFERSHYIIDDYIGSIIVVHANNTMMNYKEILLGDLFVLDYINENIQKSVLNRFKYYKEYVYLKVLYKDVDYRYINMEKKISFLGKALLDILLESYLVNKLLVKYFKRNKKNKTY